MGEIVKQQGHCVESLFAGGVVILVGKSAVGILNHIWVYNLVFGQVYDTDYE